MAFKRRLTAQGPAAAYDTIMSSHDRNTNQSSSAVSRICDSISGGRVRISSSEGHEWSMHGPANKDSVMNLGDIGGDTGANQSADEPETESARQSTFMRFQQFCRPVNWAQMNPTVLLEPEAESARQSPYMRFQSQVRPVDRP